MAKASAPGAGSPSASEPLLATADFVIRGSHATRFDLVAAALFGAFLVGVAPFGISRGGAVAAISAVSGAYGIFVLVLTALDACAPGATWAGTPGGLVRVRGGEVRTIPWERFAVAGGGPVSKRSTHGAVYLMRRFPFRGVGFVRAREGIVWNVGQTIRWRNVERAAEVRDACRRHIDAIRREG